MNQLSIIATAQDNMVTMTSLEIVDFINAHRKEEADAAGVSFPSKGFAKLEHKNFLPKVPEVLGAETSAKFLADLPRLTRTRSQGGFFVVILPMLRYNHHIGAS